MIGYYDFIGGMWFNCEQSGLPQNLLVFIVQVLLFTFI